MKRLLRVIISVTLLCISLAAIVFFVWPAYQEFSLLRARVQEDKDRLERGQAALAQLREVQEQVLLRQEEFAKIDQAIPQDAGLPALYEHIQQLGSTSGLILNSIDGQAVPGPRLEIVSLVLNVEFAGSYEGLKNFLDAARRSDRILNVSTLNISAAGGENPDNLNISITLSAYAAP